MKRFRIAVVPLASTLLVLFYYFRVSPLLSSFQSMTYDGSWSPSNIHVAIIGSSGYIGSRLYDYFQRETAWLVQGYDRIYPRRASHQISTEQLHRFQVIIYLGGLTGRKMCLQRPNDIERENIDDIYQLAKRMLPHQLLIFASTSAITEGSGSQHAAEDWFVRASLLDSYSSSLFRRENKLRQLSNESATAPRMIGLRFGTVVGLSDNQRTDLAHMALVCQAFLGGRLTVTHPESYRAFLSMEDLLRAITMLVQYSHKANRFDLFHLQSFAGSISSVANNIASRTGAHIDASDHRPYQNSIGFSMNASKFARTFHFAFRDNSTTTIDLLLHNVPRLCSGRRSHPTETDTPTVRCLVCGSSILHTVLDLHSQPLANDFRNSTAESLKCERFPLRLMRCPRCHHTQLSHIVDRSYLFSHYLYQSGTSQSLKDYFDWLADKTINESNIKNGTVLEIACNDGSQLNQFAKRGWRTVGVDPAKNLADIARSHGHDVHVGFWGRDRFPRLPSPSSLNIIVAQNVLAHVEDPVRFLKACVAAMGHTTKLYIQTSQCEMYETGQFDTVYHEHVSFFTAHSFKKIASLVGLQVINFEITPIHGRSCLVTFRRMLEFHPQLVNTSIGDTRSSSTFAVALEKERQLGFTDPWFYVKYEAQAQAMRRWIVRQLETLHGQGHTLVAYGAAAKGMVLLHFLLEISPRIWNLSYVVDDAPLKQGTFCPGTSIPVLPTSTLSNHPADKPLTILVFAWNFWQEISHRIRRQTIDSGLQTVFILLPFPSQQLIALRPDTSIVLSTNNYRSLPLPSVQKTVARALVLVAHFYNEEFLLPYWIRHHAPMFDLAVLIDYNSTDRSVEIIREEAPSTWRIVASRNSKFIAEAVDAEVVEYEAMYPDAWKITLNIPEFLVHPKFREAMGTAENVSAALRFRSIIMSGNDSNPIDRFTALPVQRSQYICNNLSQSEIRGITLYSRFIHRLSKAVYKRGRHSLEDTTWKWLPTGFICKYSYTPWPEIMNRKLQIRNRIPADEFLQRRGIQHDIDEQKLIKQVETVRALGQCNLESFSAATDELMMIHRSWKETFNY